jgi:hypothetical protein
LLQLAYNLASLTQPKSSLWVTVKVGLHTNAMPPTIHKERIIMSSTMLGKYAFWVGLVLAIVIALVPDLDPAFTWVMIVLGLIGGYLRVSEKSETHFFLMTLSLAVFSGSLAELPTIGAFITDILDGATTFLGAAVVAIAFRNILGWFR